MRAYEHAMSCVRRPAMALFICAALNAGAVDLTQIPLTLPKPPAPNVILTVEESPTLLQAGSGLEFIHSYLHALPAYRYFYSAHYNPLYYNPNVKYKRPKRPDGSEYTTSFGAAYRNGFNPESETVNLGSQYRPTGAYDPDTDRDVAGRHPQIDTGAGKPFSAVDTNTSAYYYKFNSGEGCDPERDTRKESCYELVWVSATSGPGGTDERENFANWYSFYRTHYLAIITALHLVMPRLEGKVRLAWQGTSVEANRWYLDPAYLKNACYGFTGTTCRGRGGVTFDNQLKPFSGAHKNAFYNWLARLGNIGLDWKAPYNVSMREALNRAGDYLRSRDLYCEDLTSPAHPIDNPPRSCRDNIHIMIGHGEARDDSDALPRMALETDDWMFYDIDSIAPLSTPNPAVVYTPRAPYMDYPKKHVRPRVSECFFTFYEEESCPDLPSVSPGGLPSLPSSVYWYVALGDPFWPNAHTLADLAFYYWVKDLVPDLENNVVPYMPDKRGATEDDRIWNPRNNPANWQHLVNYTLITGRSYWLKKNWGTNTYDGAQAKGEKNWPYVILWSYFTPARLYDYWHAAINSRGQFHAVDEADRVIVALDAIVRRIEQRLAASAAIAVNSTRLDTGTVLYQATFTSVDWTGELVAWALNPDGSVGDLQWSASIPSAAERKLITHDGSMAVPFASTALLPADWASQVDVPGATAAEVLAWLRGDQTNELKYNEDGELVGGKYRMRKTLLGDIVNSDPVFVGSQDYGYAVLPEGSGDAYKNFVNANKKRVKMLYVGANDGMLHGFVAGSGTGAEHACGGTLGREIFAYIPKAARAKMPTLANPAYGQPGSSVLHLYYVDGSPAAGDAYLQGAWKTVLVGTTGAGGRTVFALDVTNPCEFGPDKVLWERDENWDADIGYTLAKPIIARLNNGKWAAVFGNGYNSASGHAVLFIVDLATGELIRKIDVGGSDNGLAAPSLYDADGNGTTDFIYAGDLKGRMWKFDVSSASEADWQTAFGDDPLFTAVGPDGRAQPITAAPELGTPPTGVDGVMVYFGTGRYFANGDEVDHKVQSLYGLLDTGVAIAGRSALVAQSITSEESADGKTVRKSTKNFVSFPTKRGWYMDLDFGGAKGERVIGTPRRVFNRVFFTTMVPEADPCVFGGRSWLIELEPATGAMPETSVIDLAGEVVAGVMSSVGLVKSFEFLSGGVGAVAIGLGSRGSTETIRLNAPTIGMPTGRISWREIID